MEYTWLTFLMIGLNIALIFTLTGATAFAWFSYKDMQTARSLRNDLAAAIDDIQAQQQEAMNNLINEGMDAIRLVRDTPPD